MMLSNVPTLSRVSGAFDVSAFAPLLTRPGEITRGSLQGICYQARVAIPDYAAAIARHYAAIATDGLAAACAQAQVPFQLPRFGLVIGFEQRAEIAVHGPDMVLDGSFRALVAEFGAVILQNACVAGDGRQRFHRNIFPHLKFHVDRGPSSANQYSCFTRDPDDPVQRFPRASSTLFIANIVAWLEAVHAGQVDPADERGVRASYQLFGAGAAAGLLGEIILEQAWQAPEGSGEIAIIDNRTVLHAAYDKQETLRGYPIGARYLA